MGCYIYAMLGSQHPWQHFRVVAPLGELSLCLYTPKTNLGVEGNWIDGMTLHSYPPHLLTPLHAFRGLFSNAYLLPPTPNPLPIYVSVQVLHPSYQNVHARRHLTLIDTYEATPPLGQNDLLLAHIYDLHLSYASFLAN